MLGWQGKRIWLDINNLLGSKVGDLKKTNTKKTKQSTKASKKEQVHNLVDSAKSQMAMGIEAVGEGLEEVEEEVKEIVGFKVCGSSFFIVFDQFHTKFFLFVCILF